MSLQIRRGTSAQLAVITPVIGELIYTTDTQQVYVGDGTTTGGYRGDTVEITDIAEGIFVVNAVLTQSGTEATPFSATVS